MGHMKKLLVTTATRQHQKENWKHLRTVYPATAARIYMIANLADVAEIATVQKVLKIQTSVAEIVNLYN